MEDAAMEQQDQGGMLGEERVKWDPQKVLKKTVTSSCWKFLYFIGSKDLACKKRVFCKLCLEGSLGQAQGIPYSGSTTNLTNHMQLKHKEAFNAEVIAEQNEKKKLDLNQNKLDAYFKPSKASPKWKKSSEKWKAVTKLIAKWFVKDTRPAGMVQDQGFVNLMGILAPEYDVPCQDTITKYIDTLYIEEHTKVLEELSEIDHCAVTSDGGAASNAMSFQNTNVHFIDEEMNLKHRTLAVKENKEKHTAVNYREKTNEILDEFGISEKVFMYVTDNENKMKAAFEKEERSGCISHIIHSSVSKAIDEVDEIKKVILKSRKISQKHNKSYAMRYGLEKAQKTIGIKLRPLQRDVENRWGSTRNCTESILDHEEDVKKRIGNPSALGDGLDEYHNARAINEALRGLKFTKKQKLSDFLLTGRDMARIKNLRKVLTKLDIYSTTLGGSDFVSCSIVMPVVKSFQTVLKPDDDDPYYIDLLKRFILNDFKKRMQDNLNCKFLLTATCLDPRFKKLKVLEGKDAGAEVYKQIEAEARVLKADAKRNDAKKDASNKVTGDKVVIVKKRKLGLLFEESSDEEEDDQDDHDILREVECYKAETEISTDEEDILGWWRERKEKYPNLIRVVRKFLCVPATSNPPTCPINGLDRGGGGPPSEGLVQADGDAVNVEEEEDAPPLVRGHGGPSIKPSSFLLPPVPPLGGVAATPAILRVHEPLGVLDTSLLPNSCPVLHWEIRLLLAGLKPPSPGLPWYSMSRMPSNLSTMRFTPTTPSVTL